MGQAIDDGTRAIPATVRSGFPSGIAPKQGVRAVRRFHETVKRSRSNRRLPMRSAVGRQTQERPNSALTGCPCNGNFNALRYQSAMRNSIALWIELGSCAASPPEAKSARPNLQPNHDAGAGLVPAASSRHPAQSDILRPAVGKVPRMCRWQILEVVKCYECRD